MTETGWAGGDIASPEIGRGYFWETDAEQLFRECGHDCHLASPPGPDTAWILPR